MRKTINTNTEIEKAMAIEMIRHLERSEKLAGIDVSKLITEVLKRIDEPIIQKSA